MTIKQVVIDVDGVLTDGKQYIDHTGTKLFKAFHTRDIRAIRELVANGIAVILVSADDWEGAIKWAERVGASFVCARDKFAFVLGARFDPEETAIIGDDAWDVAALKWASMAYCPMDADDFVLEDRHVRVLSCFAGQGVIAHLVRMAKIEGWL